MGDLENEAVRLLESGKLRRAERVLKQMLKVDQNSVAAHFNLVRVYWRTGEYGRALRHGRRTLKLSPKERNACLNLGLVYDLTGHDKLAIHFYKKELSCNPGSAETHWNIGRLYFENHRWLHASKHLRSCFDSGYEFELEDTVNKLGACYFKRRDLQSYIVLFARYVRMAPNASWAFANLGRALLHAKDYKGAVLRLSRAEKLGFRNSLTVELARARNLLQKNKSGSTQKVSAV